MSTGERSGDGSTTRPSLVERRAQQLRLEVARVAVRIFADDGDTSATVERIAAKAGISARTFHRRFPAKEDVVRPLFRESIEMTIAALRAAPPGGDPVDLLVSSFLSRARQQHELTESDRVFMRLVSENPQLRLRWLEIDEELADEVTEFLAGRVELDPDPLLRSLLATMIVHTARYVLEHWALGRSRGSVVPLLERGIRQVLHGLDPGTAHPGRLRRAGVSTSVTT